MVELSEELLCLYLVKFCWRMREKEGGKESGYSVRLLIDDFLERATFLLVWKREIAAKWAVFFIKVRCKKFFWCCCEGLCKRIFLMCLVRSAWSECLGALSPDDIIDNLSPWGLIGDWQTLTTGYQSPWSSVLWLAFCALGPVFSVWW